jgi:hypothetical protein
MEEEEERSHIPVTLIVHGRSDQIISCFGKLTVAQATCYLRNKFALLGGIFTVDSKPVYGFDEFAIELFLRFGNLIFEYAQPSPNSGISKQLTVFTNSLLIYSQI